MADKMYLIVLNGGGDTSVTIVNEAVWDWIGLPYDPESAVGDAGEYAYYEKVPEAVLLEAEKQDCEPFSDGVELHITSGSWENDRALAAPGIAFWDLAEALQYLKEENIVIEDTFEGCIY